MNKLINILNGLEKVITIITGIMILLLTLLISWQVFSRYVLNTGQFWAEELAVISMMWIGFLGAAGALWTDSHIGLNLFVQRFPESLQLCLCVLRNIILTAFSLILFYNGIILVKRTMGGTLSALGFSIGYSYLIVPVSGLLLVLFAIIKSAKEIFDYFGLGVN
ncbi:TRAP transporter small permease subunit [Iocasia frigidifontis]|uniref:TRAP transporter small permease subunit n=1 Tax=Iocasia fonsfrigidae TaxID=2682810 RepID=A0A8A7KCW1_9FIRM|nr:TRAP transporter small permease [Iocasia fonsfrigidae]QTL96717.1 TRAP transporter small permease subunit [Iocasia fonsfrigidae]